MGKNDKDYHGYLRMTLKMFKIEDKCFLTFQCKLNAGQQATLIITHTVQPQARDAQISPGGGGKHTSKNWTQVLNSGELLTIHES